MSSVRIRDLKGLGPKSEADLCSVGINTVEELKALGPIPAYMKLRTANPKVSLNFLYALVGALNNEHWINVAREDKSALLQELEGFEALQKILLADGLSL
jgi:DNA transformation protein